MSKFYNCSSCNPPSSFHGITGPYYVILSPLIPPVMKFNYYNQLLTVRVEVTLCGNFALPINCLMLNLTTGLGDFQQIPMHLDWVGSQTELTDRIQGHHYWTEFNLDLTKSNRTQSNLATQSFSFYGTLKINESVFNEFQMAENFYKFCTDLNKIQLNTTLFLNNYLPISKLSHYYLVDKWQNQWMNTNYINDPLAFNWEKTHMTPTATFVLDKVEPIQTEATGEIYHLYTSNIGNGGLTHYFKNIELNLAYVWNGQSIKQTLLVNDAVAQKTDYSVDLCLNIKTLFNFQTHKLEFSDQGVNGIYFPVVCSGTLTLKMNREGVNYIDNIPFAFRHNFYSAENNLYKVSLLTSSNHEGYFHKLVHA